MISPTCRALAVLLLVAALVGTARAQVPASAPALKKTIVVDAFDNRSSGAGAADAQIAARLADQLSDALSRSGAFVVIERAPAPAAGYPGADPYNADPGYAPPLPPMPMARPAQAISAQLLVRGTLTDLSLQAGGGSNGLNVAGVRLGARSSLAQVGMIVRLIDAGTQQVLASHRVAGKAKSKGMQLGLDIEGYNYEGDNFKETPIGQAGQVAIDAAVRFIVDEMRDVPFSARVVKARNDGSAIISCGAMSGLLPGMRFAVMSVGEALRDPSSDELLGFEQSELGTVTVTRVFDRFAYTSQLSGMKSGDILLLQ